jgi:hypothetical protein
MRSITANLALLSLTAVSCGKSATKLGQEVRDCSAITIDAPGISRCLVAQFRWAPAKATAAGVARQRELDSIAAFRKDSAWQADAKAHRLELAGCATGGGDLARCLENAHGWDAQRAAATTDSLWRQEAPKRRSEIQTCQRQRQSTVGSCLMLYYKWDSKHALAFDDSVMRAKIKASNSR